MKNKSIETKTIKFEGGELLGVKTPEGKIYMGVRKAMRDIGLTDDQAKRQVKNIQEDMVLKRSGSNLTLLQTEGNRQVERDVLCIELDYVPLWLAKVSLTPAMQKSNPDAIEKLIAYQLKAKDVLAEAFVSTEEKRKEFSESLGLEGEIIELKEEMINLTSRIDSMMDTSTINSYQAQKINKQARQRVVSLLGGVNSKKYKENSRMYFKQLWLNLCDNYKITTYKDLNPQDVGSASDFVRNWTPKAR